MRASRFLSAVLLSAFAFWASGAAHVAHVRLEHAATRTAGATSACVPACPDCAAGVIGRLRVAVANEHRKPPASVPARPTTASCPVCELLATMTPEQGVVKVAVPVHRPLPQRASPVVDRPFLVAPAAFLPPACGPPLA